MTASERSHGKVEVIWGWVKSSDNAADIASRITATPKDLEEGTVWQDGPAYLKLPESEWPLRTDIMSGTVELPSEELRENSINIWPSNLSQKTD